MKNACIKHILSFGDLPLPFLPRYTLMQNKIYQAFLLHCKQSKMGQQEGLGVRLALALTSMIAMKEKQARKGRTKKGSGDVRSVNHRIPPSIMLSTGTAAILRIAMKKLMKMGTCMAGIRNILPGWQLCFR